MTSAPLRDLFAGRLAPAPGARGAEGGSGAIRAWPFGDGGWSALLSRGRLDPSGSRAVLHTDELPRSLRRLVDRGKAARIPGTPLVTWAPADDPILHEASGFPAADCLPGEIRRGGRARLVGYKPLRRAVVRFAGGDGTPVRHYAKHVRPGRSRGHASDHRRLARWSAADAGFRMPRLVAVTSDPDILVWEAAPGVPLRDAVLAEDGRLAAAAAGRCLASLHTCPSRAHRRRDRRSELAVAASWIELAATLDPRLAGARRLVDLLAQASTRLPTARPVLAHGDFHDGQLLLAEGGTTLLDTDTLARAEPELDVGNLLAHFDLLRLDERVVIRADLEPLLLESYSRRRGPLLDAQRVTWYRALSVLRLACVHTARGADGALTTRLADRAAELARQIWQTIEEVA